MIGISLGPYKILEKIGAGGMGEVFLAEDTRLNRKVAVKTLPEEFASDPERLARFEQEARAAAALNHPHIAVVHDIGFADGAGASSSAAGGGAAEAKTDPSLDVSSLLPAAGVHYIVQEYLEGETLRDPLKKGALPLGKALLYAREVAEALGAAHEAGIIHRDLKPDNVFITKDGHAKILDFGLAKLTELHGPGGTELSMSPTVLGTVAGQVMGTAGYMAPEQIEGDVEIDARADLFAFGCLLYEMIGGKRAFAGDSILDTLHAIARTEPQPVGELNPETPVELERILKKCLAKDRDHRYQHADDVLVDLKNLAGEVESGNVRTVADREAGGAEVFAAAGGVPWKLAAPAAIAIAAAAALTVWMLAPTGSSTGGERIIRFEMSLPDGVNYTALGLPSLAISPQGTHIAMAANNGIYLRAFDDPEAAPVRGTEGLALVPFFSPDGRSIGFFSAGELLKVSIGGGAAVKLADLQGPPLGASWTADNMVYYALDGIWRVSGDGGEPEEVIAVEEGDFYHGPQVLPDGSILYTILAADETSWDDASIVVRRPEEEEPTVLVAGGRDARYVSTGHIVYALEDAILARTFDLGTREVGGAVPLLQGVAGAFENSGASHFALSDTGDLVFIRGDMQQEPRTFVWRDGDGGKEVVAVANEAGRTWTPRLSPSGRYVAYRVNGSEGSNLWLLDLQRGIHSLFVPEAGARSFAWSPDGEYLYYSFDSGTDTGTDIYRRPADMSVDAEEFIAGPGNEFVRSISRDGEWMLYADTDVINTGAYDIKILSLTEPGDPRPVFERDVQEVTASVSPNGKWIVYVSGPQNEYQVFVQGFPNLGGITQVSEGFGSEPVWAPDSSRLFYRRDNDIMVVDVVSEQPFDISAPALFLADVSGDGQNAGSFDISHDGKRLLMVDWDDAGVGGEGKVHAVLNWFKELNERVTTGR